MKKIWKIVASLAALIVLVGFLAIGSFFVSPWPFTYVLRESGVFSTIPPTTAASKQAATKVSETKDLRYPSEYPSNQLDLYLPKTNEKKVPVIIWVHGGGFVAGDKAGLRDWANQIASQGYAVVSLNYQVSPEGTYPGPVIQVGDAYDYLSQTLAQKYPQLDLSRIVVGGDSAGAQIASQFVAVQTNKKLAKEMNIAQQVDTKALKATLLFCGPYDMDGLTNTGNRVMDTFVKQVGWAYFGDRNWLERADLQQATTTKQVTAAYPASFITDGNHLSFETQGKNLAQALKQKGVAVQTLFFDKKAGQINHEYQFQLSTKEAQTCLKETLAFLKQYTEA